MNYQQLSYQQLVRTLIVSFFVIVMGSIVCLVNVPQYTNMTDEYAQYQLGRIVGEQNAACVEIGGKLVANELGCSQAYGTYDMSWYISPRVNTLYGPWQWVVKIASILMILAGIVFLKSLGDLINQRYY